MRRGSAFVVTDRPSAAPEPGAARDLRAAIVAIERTFAAGTDWRAVVGQLRLMVRILDQPPRRCSRCRETFRLDHGVAFALYRRGLPAPRYCASCRALRRRERIESEHAARTAAKAVD